MPKLILVEDTAPLLDSLTFALELAGFEVTAFQSPLEALKNIEFIRPDLLITDLSMPVLDGFELITRLRERDLFKDLPILIFSARPRQENTARAAELGVTNYLTKPCTVERMVMEIEKMLKEKA